MNKLNNNVVMFVVQVGEENFILSGKKMDYSQSLIKVQGELKVRDGQWEKVLSSGDFLELKSTGFKHLLEHLIGSVKESAVRLYNGAPTIKERRSYKRQVVAVEKLSKKVSRQYANALRWQ